MGWNRKLRLFVEKQGWGMQVKKWFDKINIQRNKNELINTEGQLPAGKGVGGESKEGKGDQIHGDRRKLDFR